MKPLQLSMKAFGAFAEECRIDFTPFDKSGIYLITGETGAGKTTILWNGKRRCPRSETVSQSVC